MGEQIKSNRDVGDVGSIEAVGRRATASRRPGKVRAAALGELAIGNATLSRQVAALEQSNARLEELAGAVTHDLREGLATISLFVYALERRLGGELGPAAAHDLSGIRAGLERMEVLVNEELKRARVGTRRTPVDCEVALGEALANLGALIDRTDSEIVAEPMPWVSCNLAEVTRLFQNLLANSLAARASDRDLRIRVSARREGLRWRFDVEDNGVGIPPEVMERVSGPAGGAGEPDQGLGLVICRRIVEAQGGTIRAMRRAGGGTTVSFDLPAGNDSRRAAPDDAAARISPA